MSLHHLKSCLFRAFTILLISAFLFSFSTETITAKEYSIDRFSDVDPSKWYYSHIKYVYDNGLMVGTSDNQFSPNSELTRAMIVQILYKNAGSPSVEEYNIPFWDVPENKWYYKSVSWAYNNGIVAGRSYRYFDPNTYITRAELSAVFLKYASYKNLYIDPTGFKLFSDGDIIPNYASLPVKILSGIGVISGKPGNVFAPKAYATRAEAATMIHRFLESTKENKDLLVDYEINPQVFLSINYYQLYSGVPQLIINLNPSDSFSGNLEDITVSARVISLNGEVNTPLAHRGAQRYIYGDCLYDLQLKKDDFVIANITFNIGDNIEVLTFYLTVERYT